VQIEIQNLTKVYAEDRGLFPLTLAIGRGEFVAVVGHNGAGKSTLLKMLANWIVPASGQAVIDATPLEDRLDLVRKLGFVPETPNLFEFFTVEYNLKLFARLFKLPGSRVEEIMHAFELLQFRHTKVQNLSKGLKQRVSLGRALLADPKVLLLDEPTSGLDFDMTRSIYKTLKAINQLGKTILFTSHRLEEIRVLASRVIVLHQGKLFFDGAPAEFFTSKAHEELYL